MSKNTAALYIDHLRCREEAIVAEVTPGSLNEIMKLEMKKTNKKGGERLRRSMLRLPGQVP